MNISIIPNSVLSWNGGIDFLSNLLYSLSNSSVSTKMKVSLMVTNEDEEKLSFLGGNFTKIKLKSLSKDEVAQNAIIHNISLIFSFQTNLGKAMPIKWIGYIPDFQHEYLNYLFSVQEKEERDYIFSSLKQNADSLIVNSKDTKRDIIKFLGGNSERIFNLPFAPILKTEYIDYVKMDLIEKYEFLIGTYFIISNQFWQHKNHMLAFESFKLLYLSYPQFSDVKLVCTGSINDYRNSAYIDDLKAFIEKNDLQSNIIILGLIPKSEQINLLYNSIALIQPTLFEGGPGGGATYDAISLGKRVILSDIEINKEISSDKVIFFNNKSQSDLLDKMKYVLENPLTIATIEKNNDSIEVLGESLCNIFETVDSFDPHVMNKNVNIINYQKYDGNIQPSFRLPYINFNKIPNDGLFSSDVTLMVTNEESFYKEVSGEYITKFMNKAGNNNIEIDGNINEGLYSINLSYYLENYILSLLQKGSKLFIYGDGEHTKRLIKLIDFSSYNLMGVLSKSPSINQIEGVPVIKYNRDLIDQETFILISSATFEQEIFEELKQEIQEMNLLRIYGY